jgi:hypothetical protein
LRTARSRRRQLAYPLRDRVVLRKRLDKAPARGGRFGCRALVVAEREQQLLELRERFFDLTLELDKDGVEVGKSRHLRGFLRVLLASAEREPGWGIETARVAYSRMGRQSRQMRTPCRNLSSAAGWSITGPLTDAVDSVRFRTP